MGPEDQVQRRWFNSKAQGVISGKRLLTTTKCGFQWNFCTSCLHGNYQNYPSHSSPNGATSFLAWCKSSILKWRTRRRGIYRTTPGYVQKGKEDKVYHLKNALYRLKQAPRAWNSKIDSYFQQNGFQRSPSEPSLYFKKKGMKDFLLVCLYVDDLIYECKNPEMVAEFKEAIMKEYEMTDLGPMKYFLGIQVRQCKGEIFIS